MALVASFLSQIYDTRFRSIGHHGANAFFHGGLGRVGLATADDLEVGGLEVEVVFSCRCFFSNKLVIIVTIFSY